MTMNLFSVKKPSYFDSMATSRNCGTGAPDSNDPNQIISTYDNEAVETVLDDHPNNIFKAESQTQAPRDDDDDSFFIPDETSAGDAPTNNTPSESVLKKWVVSIVLNNKVATLAVLALATTFGFAIGALTWTGANEMVTSKATNCIDRRLHDDTKPHHIAVAPEAAVPSWEGRKLTACTTTINPPNTATIQNCVGSLNPGNSNVLQQAINDANANDVICMNPGKYYTACQTHVTKPLTIRGACAGIPASGDPNFDPSSEVRSGCTAETVWVASNTFNDSNGGLQGIFVDFSGVTIDGISFYEETETFRRTVGVLCDAPSGDYENIKVLNNYMKGTKISASCPIGGANGSSQFPKTITNLEYEGNFIKATAANNWEPLGFRGEGYAPGGVATPTLTNLKIANNVIGCAGSGPFDSSCQVLNLHRSFIDGDSSISNNNFYENTNNVCPITTSSSYFDSNKDGVIPGGWDNINAGVCAAYSAAPSLSPSISGSPSAFPSVSAAPSKAGKSTTTTRAPKSGKCTGRVRK